MPLYYEFQLSVECRGNNSHRVDPRASQKAAVSGVNIHYLKGNLTGMRAYLYREVDLSPNLSAGAVEGTNHHGTWL